MTLKKIVIILVCVILLAGSVYLGVLTLNNLKANNHAVEIPVNDGFPTIPNIGNDQATATTTTAAITDADIVWLAVPVKLANLKLVDYSGDSTGMPAIESYKVAMAKNGAEIIDEFIQPQNPGAKMVIRFQKTASGKYLLISKNSDYQGGEQESLDNGFVNQAAVDSKTDLNSLNAPAKISFNNLAFTEKEWSNKMPLDWNKLEKISSTANGNFYKKLTPTDNDLSLAEYVLKLPDSTAMYYDMPINFLASDYSLMATFNNENKEFKDKKFISTVSKSCSISAPVIVTSGITGRLYSIGTTTSGTILYAPKNVNDALFRAVYDIYKIGRAGEGTTTFDGQPVLTYEEMVAKKPVVVWRDGLGDYHVFYDSDFSPLAECGKPVIYLYPTTKTEVKVRVGAKVRISEPLYGNGWNVVAYPDGKIINSDGAVYENLYWEGMGRGTYPAITQGRVVKQANIETELRRDLKALGLNQKEAADFMEFWLPKTPKSPYIRLTWLDTAAMNELAPLMISPRPETVARIFLDFCGQETVKTDLSPQQLQGFKRNGFTVVEWGGLLVGGK